MRLFFIALSILIILGCDTRELQRIEDFSGEKLSINIEMITKIDKWTSPSGGGYSIRIYRINDEQFWIDPRNCNTKGFTRNKLRDMSVRFPVIEEYLDLDMPVCYKFETNFTNEQLVLLQKNNIYHYWASF